MKTFNKYVEEQDGAMDMDIEMKPGAPAGIGGEGGDDMGMDNDPMAAIEEIMEICKRVLGGGGEDDLGAGGPPMGGPEDEETKSISRPMADGPGAPGGMFGMGN